MPSGQVDECMEAMTLTSICGLGQAADPRPDGASALARAVREDDGMIEFTLDGRIASAQEGELLVHAAAWNGVFIPTSPLRRQAGALWRVAACAQAVDVGFATAAAGGKGDPRRSGHGGRDELEACRGCGGR